MATRTTRSFSDTDRKELLNELANWRSKCVSVCTKSPIKSDAYKIADKLIGDIDTAVEALTGDRKYLYAKPN